MSGVLVSPCCCSHCVWRLWCHIVVAHIVSWRSGVTLLLLTLCLGVLVSHCCCSHCVWGFWCHLVVARIVSGGYGVTLLLLPLCLGVLVSDCRCSLCVWGFWCHIVVAHIVSGGSGVTLLLLTLSWGSGVTLLLNVSGGSGVRLPVLTLCLGVLVSHCCCSHNVWGFWCHLVVAHTVSGGFVLCPGPEVIKLFLYSTQLSTKFTLLINVKMPTIV